MKIGAHVSIAGGIENAPINAAKIGCECFQFFSRSPQGGLAKEISLIDAENFLSNCRDVKINPEDCVIHSSYFINLASLNSRIFYGSISALKRELKVAEMLKTPFVVTHLGSAKDFPDGQEAEVREKVLLALREIFEKENFKAQLLLEIASGSGKILGSTFEEIGFYIKKSEKFGINLGFCLDTCHSFAAGYDLRSAENVDGVFKMLDKFIGLDRLKMIHFNDSKVDFNSKKDRHAHIGEGKIGLAGLGAVARWAEKLDVNLILETEHDKILEDLELTRKMRR